MKLNDRALRCGSLADAHAVFEDQPSNLAAVRNRYLLSMEVDVAEMEQFISQRASHVGLRVFASPAEVMYAVISIQLGRVQWRLVVPFWSEQARAWFEDMLAQRTVTLAAKLAGTSKVALLDWTSRWPQGTVVLDLANEWPELADRDKLMDCSVVVGSLIRTDGMPIDAASAPVEEVRVVTHCPWLHSNVDLSNLSEQELEEDARTYAQLVH